MSPTMDQMREAQRALDAPLFSGLPGDVEVSFEFFPPKNDKMNETLWHSVETLAPLGPRFASVTNIASSLCCSTSPAASRNPLQTRRRPAMTRRWRRASGVFPARTLLRNRKRMLPSLSSSPL